MGKYLLSSERPQIGMAWNICFRFPALVLFKSQHNILCVRFLMGPLNQAAILQTEVVQSSRREDSEWLPLHRWDQVMSLLHVSHLSSPIRTTDRDSAYWEKRSFCTFSKPVWLTGLQLQTVSKWPHHVGACVKVAPKHGEKGVAELRCSLQGNCQRPEGLLANLTSWLFYHIPIVSSWIPSI